MRKIPLAVVGAVSIAVAAAPLATATRVGGTAPSAAVIGASSGAYHHARVLEPGSRSSVVEI